LNAGRTWAELAKFAQDISDDVFISRNVEKLAERGVDLLFHPGTHDMVAFDLAWGGAHHPDLPVYLKANSGHGKKGHPAAERDEQNKAAFLLGHFFDGVEPLLTAPTVEWKVNGDVVEVAVQFRAGSGEESGRIWWMTNRPPDGSPGYLSEMIPDDNWMDMERDGESGAWTASIPIPADAQRLDFFSNHRKVVSYRGKTYATYLSSPYTRVVLKGMNNLSP